VPYQSHVIDRPDLTPEAIPTAERLSSHGVEPTRRDVVNVYLIPLGATGPIFYSEGPVREDARPSLEPKGGPRGWLERKFRSMQTALHRSEGGMGLRIRRLWGWLQRRIPPDEPLLRRLRKAGMVVVHHPSLFTREEARAEWLAYLAGRRGRHLLGLTLNLAISPLTILLVPVPGPNVVGFWFAYRTVCHTLALLGIHRASGPRVTTAFRPSADLDEAPGEGLRSRAARLARFARAERSVPSSLLPPGEGGRDGRMRVPGSPISPVLGREVDFEANVLIRPFGAPSPGGRRGSGSASSATQWETAPGTWSSPMIRPPARPGAIRDGGRSGGRDFRG